MKKYKCIRCGRRRSFNEDKWVSSIACPKCLNDNSAKIDEDIENGVEYRCNRCKRKFTIQKNKSLIVCQCCAKEVLGGDPWDFYEMVDNRFEILDL